MEDESSKKGKRVGKEWNVRTDLDKNVRSRTTGENLNKTSVVAVASEWMIAVRTWVSEMTGEPRFEKEKVTVSL